MRAHPFHLALMISSGTVAIANLLFSGVVLTGHIGNLVGVAMLFASVALFGGWVMQNQRTTENALLLAAGAWSARAMFALLTTPDGAVFTAVISASWAIGAGGSYWVERHNE